MIRIGIVGVGGMGTVHYMNYQHIDGVEIVGLVGVSESDKNKAALWGLPIYPSITELCKNVKLDVIDVCTPTFLHPKNVKEALLLDKNVICEKPLALKSIDAIQLFDLAKRQGKHLYVGQVVQFTKPTQILRELIETQVFGRPLDAVFERMSAKPNWGTDSWMFDKEKGGLIPYDLHIHDLDMIISLFGTPKGVEVQASQGLLEFPEYYRFIYKYDDVNVLAHASWLNAKIPFMAEWRVYFEKAYVVNDGNNVVAYPAEGDPIYYDVDEKIKIETGINIPPTGMYLEQLQHFIDCIKDDRDSDIVTKNQIVETLKVLESVSN